MTRFEVRGALVEIEGPDDSISGAVRRRLRLHETHDERAPDLTVTYEPARPSAKRAEGRVVYESLLGEVRYSDSQDALWFLGSGFELTCRGADASACARIAPHALAADWLGSRPILTVALLELLRRVGLFPIHAGSVERDGRAILIAGTSGSGKSTLTLALALDGFAFMGDDLALLDRRTGTLRVSALHEELDVTAWAAEALPELGITGEPAPGWAKHAIDPEAIFGDTIAEEGEPALILFPSRADRSGPQAHPLTPAEALLRVVPDVLLTHRDAVEGHLSAIRELVESASSYELRVPLDPREACATVEGLLRG